MERFARMYLPHIRCPVIETRFDLADRCETVYKNSFPLGERGMSAVVIDSSIAQLQRLSAYLVDELGELRAQSRAATVEARACKELLLSITVLIPKLQAARY